jgi:L-iditol 2-dehydrogenase
VPTMQAAVFRGRNDLPLEDVEKPEIGCDELLVRVHECGLCGSDIAKVVHALAAPGAILGHEVVGTVAEVGAEVRSFQVGQRVVVAHHVPCFNCHYCRHGSHTMCLAFKESNLDPGGFAQYVRVPGANVRHVTLAIPSTMSWDVASFTEPLACCLRAVKRSGIEPSDSVLVAGAGSIGLLIAQLTTRYYGATTFISDVLPGRLDLARALGVTHAVDARKEDVAGRCRALTEDRGVDAVISTVTAPQSLKQAMGAVRDGGSINVFAADPARAGVPFDFYGLYRRELSLFSTYSTTPMDVHEAFGLLHSGGIDVQYLVSHRLPMSRLLDGVELTLAHKALKVLIEVEER